MCTRPAVMVALGLALLSFGSREAFADPAVLHVTSGQRAVSSDEARHSRLTGRETKCVRDDFSRLTMTSDSRACRPDNKNGKNSAGAPRLQFPPVEAMAAAVAWEAFPAAGLSALDRGTHQPSFTSLFSNASAGAVDLDAKLGGGSGVSPAGHGEPTLKFSFIGDVGLPTDQSLDDAFRRQYRGAAAIDNDTISEKLVNAIGAVKLGFDLRY